LDYRIALFSNLPVFIEEIKKDQSLKGLSHYKTFESIKPDEFDLLIVAPDVIEDESAQFVLSRIRKKIQSKPVIIVLNEDLTDDFDTEWFFDDFMLYPLRKGELFLRIRNSLGDIQSEDESVIAIGSLKIDLQSFSVFLNNEKLDFTYKEFELLRFLVQNRGKVFSRKDLLNKIWGIEYIGGTRTVDVHIRRLRSKLGVEFTSIIETVRNVGYRCKE